MREWVIILFFLGNAWPAMADKVLSIDQMEQLLTKLQGKPDGKVSGELEGVQLAERVSLARLARWEAEFPGKRTQEDLIKLADFSEFLNAPASDVLRDPPPDANTEERMMALAEDYVKLTTARLPDFYATRETTHFEDTLSHRAEYTSVGPMAMGAQGSPRGLPTQTPGLGIAVEFKELHSTGEFSMTVAYRDGREVLDEAAEKRKKEQESTLGLTSSGEFGPILVEVIDDLMNSGVSWLRWEQGIGEPAAVFHYAVAANISHFRIGDSAEGRAQEISPAYHGEIEIDPETGQILRVTEVADAAPGQGLVLAAKAVDYAPVKIGGQSYILPVRGIAYSMIPVASPGATDEASEPVQVNLNDVAFTNYHESGSEARIVAAADNLAAAATSSASSASSSSGSASEAASSTARPAAEVTEATPASNRAPSSAVNAAPVPAANPAAGPTANSKPASGNGALPGPMTAAAVLGAPASRQFLFLARVLAEGDPKLQGPEPENAPAGDKSANLKGGAHRYIVDLTLDPQDLTFAQAADGKKSTELECALVAYDSAGNSVNSLDRKLDFNLTPEQYEQITAERRGIPVRLALDLPSGAIVIRAVVYDPATAKTGSLEIPVQVASK